jgi:hypothetical protein
MLLLLLSLLLSRPSHAAVAPFLQTVLQPRLAACLTALVGCQPAEPDAVSARTQQLMATAGRAAAGSQTQCGPPSCCVTQQEAAAARLLVVFDTMQQLPAQCAAAAIGPLLSWAPLALGAGDCCAFVLTHDSGGALLQHALQACLACWTTAAYGQPPPMHTQLLMTVTGMGAHYCWCCCAENHVLLLLLLLPLLQGLATGVACCCLLLLFLALTQVGWQHAVVLCWCDARMATTH